MAERPDELRADLQQHYEIDLDRAAAGAHSAEHVAALTACLPAESRLRRQAGPDGAWGLQEVLLAVIANNLRGIAWGLSDDRKRGRRPEPIGPSWMTEGAKRSLPARKMPARELMEELKKPRRAHD